jgi:hypothetical protein
MKPRPTPSPDDVLRRVLGPRQIARPAEGEAREEAEES